MKNISLKDIEQLLDHKFSTCKSSPNNDVVTFYLTYR